MHGSSLFSASFDTFFSKAFISTTCLGCRLSGAHFLDFFLCYIFFVSCCCKFTCERAHVLDKSAWCKCGVFECKRGAVRLYASCTPGMHPKCMRIARLMCVTTVCKRLQSNAFGAVTTLRIDLTEFLRCGASVSASVYVISIYSRCVRPIRHLVGCLAVIWRKKVVFNNCKPKSVRMRIWPNFWIAMG